MSIEVCPYDDAAAMTVFSHLDPGDLMEMTIQRGEMPNSLALFADWRAQQGQAVASFVLKTKNHRRFHDRAFAVIALAHSGFYGVAQAALLAREHAKWRGPIARAAVLIRRRLDSFCGETGIRRIEVRSWSGHPTACNLLSSIGFAKEHTALGFGPDGDDSFDLYSYLPQPHQTNKRGPKCVE